MDNVTRLPIGQAQQDRPALRAPAPSAELAARLRALLPPPIKVVHVPESISQDEADQIRRAVEQIETAPLGRAA